MSDRFVSFPGVAAGVSFLEVGDCQSNVMLKRIEVLVPEKIFDVPEICTAANEFGRTGAPKGMGCDRERQAQS